MRQKLVSFGDDYWIENALDQRVFFVDCKAFRLREHLGFQDMQGNELAFIRQKLLAWGPTYEIHSQGQLQAIIKKAVFTLFHCSFSVDVPGPGDLDARGDFTDHEYQFERAGDTVATVSKRWFSWTDSYGVEIAEGEDDILILASTVVIDMACHEEHDE